MSKAKLVLSALLLVLLVAACAPKAAPTSAPAPPAPAPAPVAAPARAPVAAPARAAWEIEWEQTLAAAKKEGGPLLYVGFGGEHLQNLLNAFRSRYGVRIEAMTGSTPEFVAKVSAEQRAGIYSGDVLVAGSTSAVSYKGLLDSLDWALILPELTEPELIKKTWYFGELSWGDKAHTVVTSLMDVKQSICFNTSLVKAGEITAYRDLLDPKWKGKISLNDPRTTGSGRQWFAVVLELGDVDVNFMRELLTKQELFVTRDRRLQVEWVARGKHSIAVGAYTPAINEFISLGAPVSRISLGTPWMSASTSGTATWKRAPHPNAAKLFINWVLGQEGQTFHSRAVGVPSQRFDVPTTHLDASKVLKAGLKVFRADDEDYVNKQDTYYAKLAVEILGP